MLDIFFFFMKGIKLYRIKKSLKIKIIYVEISSLIILKNQYAAFLTFYYNYSGYGHIG